MRRWTLLVVMTLSLLGLAGPAQWLHQQAHHAPGSAPGSTPGSVIESVSGTDAGALAGCRAQADDEGPADAHGPSHTPDDCATCHLLVHMGRLLWLPTPEAGQFDEPLLVACLAWIDAQAPPTAHVTHLGGRDPPSIL